MEIEIIEDDDVITIIVKGEIEIYSFDGFKNELFEISHTTNKNIDIDLSELDYIDSSGIGVLVSLYKLQNKKGKKLIIRKVNPDILNILKLTTLSDVFEM